MGEESSEAFIKEYAEIELDLLIELINNDEDYGTFQEKNLRKIKIRKESILEEMYKKRYDTIRNCLSDSFPDPTVEEIISFVPDSKNFFENIWVPMNALRRKTYINAAKL